ncbi:TadE/TadG family type IV pilus assembly protein [Salinarimonas soli]|uniref:VWFA domain-containing protein n=1 Tax=Salinarimonas soli TaxID=1638099 RepID=A0A5B2V997_9HYPH|nr:TadE/TadG family type IV pilus assembly protein [Salinarimonas soli]KAA2234807.1 hypothetical protein F0L46_22935 [Salinarimonas soli]
MIKYLPSFLCEKRGGVGVLFALVLVPLVGSAGAALDYNRAMSLRETMQTAADGTALSVAKATGDFTARKQQGLAFLTKQLPQRDGITYQPAVEQVLQNGQESAVRVTVSTAVPTTLLSVLGIRTVPVAVESQATSGRNERFDVAFVLDTTGSMMGARMTSLKSATTALIDDFIARRGDADQIHVSVIPFAQYVNIGLGNRNQPWLDVPADYQTPVKEKCEDVREVVGQQCEKVFQPAQPAQPRTCYNDGTPYSCDIAAQPARWVDQCTPIYGNNMVKQCTKSGGSWVRWNGCVGSRPYPDETRDGNYSVRIPGLMNISCASPILEPTNDLSLAKSRINALTTNGETYLPAGLLWGWRALSTQAPLSARTAQAGSPVSRNMILVTDGMNTVSQRNRNSKFHDGKNAAEADTITKLTCQNMAADTASGIRLFTIAFEVTDANVKKLLTECSTLNGGAFYDAADAAQLQDALRNIGGQISKLRIAR